MLLFGSGARNGFSGGCVACRAGFALEAWSWKAGREGAGPDDGIGIADALPP